MAEPDCRQARRTDKPTDANLQTQRRCDLPSSQNFGTTEFCLMMSPKNGSAWPVILCCRNLLIFWQQAFYVGFDQLMLTILEGGFKVEFELVKFKLYQAKSSKSSKTSTSARFHDLPPMSIGSKPPCFDLRFELTSYLKPPGGKMKPNLPIAETNQRCGWQALDITGPLYLCYYGDNFVVGSIWRSTTRTTRCHVDVWWFVGFGKISRRPPECSKQSARSSLI